MNPNEIFNATVCIIGIAILLIHITNLFFKKNRRQDENRLFLFLIFTAFHLATYLTFTLLKTNYTSDNFIIGFYTTFYIFNNIEVLLLFLYTISYVELTNKNKKILTFFFVSGITRVTNGNEVAGMVFLRPFCFLCMYPKTGAA